VVYVVVNSWKATKSIRMKFWNDCISIVSRWSNNEWHSPLMFCSRIQGLIKYFRRRLRFLLNNMYAATIIIYCYPQAAATTASTSTILQMIDRRSLCYRATVFLPIGNLNDISSILSVSKLADLPASGAAVFYQHHNSQNSGYREKTCERYFGS